MEHRSVAYWHRRRNWPEREWADFDWDSSETQPVVDAFAFEVQSVKKPFLTSCSRASRKSSMN